MPIDFLLGLLTLSLNIYFERFFNKKQGAGDRMTINPHNKPTNPQQLTLQKLDRQHTWHPFTNMTTHQTADFPIIERGQGSSLFDLAGQEYIDAVSSWWCVNLGHSHPRLIHALKTQADSLQHTMLGGLSHPKVIELSARLSKLSGMPYVFYASDGASAVECSLRLAIEARRLGNESHKKRFVSLKDGYHGDTQACVGVGYVESFHKGLDGVITKSDVATAPRCYQCPFGLNRHDCDAPCYEDSSPQDTVDHPTHQPMASLLNQNHANIAAVIVEPLCQGAAGVRFYSPRYLQKLRKQCDELGLWLIADEIAVGYGRTGQFFACDTAGIKVDMMTLGKGMTGGYLPMSAVLVSQEIFDRFQDNTFFYGHTFTGNPLCAALACEVLQIYEEEGQALMSAVAPAVEQTIQKAAEAIGCILGVAPPSFDVMSSMGAIYLDTLENANAKVLAEAIACFAKDLGLWIRPLGATLYLWPPLNSGADTMKAIDEKLLAAIACLEPQSLKQFQVQPPPNLTLNPPKKV